MHLMPHFNGSATDPAYFRGRARKFRRSAAGAGDAVTHQEMLRLAEVFDRMAANAEVERRAGIAPRAD